MTDGRIAPFGAPRGARRVDSFAAKDGAVVPRSGVPSAAGSARGRGRSQP
jgi:hypothetical protein